MWIEYHWGKMNGLKSCMLVTLCLLFFLSLFCSVSSAETYETLTFEPLVYECVSNLVCDEGLIVRYESGFVWISYLAFDLSETPPGAEVESAVLQLKADAVIKYVWVSVYWSSNIEWAKKGISWETKSDIDDYADAKWISVWEEWYS